MLKALNDLVLRGSHYPLLILILFVASNLGYGVLYVMAQLFDGATGGLFVFDGQPSLTVGGIYDQLPRYTEEARNIYRAVVAVDVVLPSVSYAFFALFSAALLRVSPIPLARRLARVGVPLLALLPIPFDLVETLGFLFVVESYPGRVESVASVALVFQDLKYASFFPAFGVALLALLIGGLPAAYHRLRRGRWPR